MPPPLAESRELIVLTREGPTTLSRDDNGSTAGFEHSLVTLFAAELGKKPRFVVVRDDAEIAERLKAGRGHLGAAWLTPPDDPALVAGPSFFTSGNVVAQNEGALTINSPEDLAGRTLHVLAGSRQAAALHALRERIGGLDVVEADDGSELDLLGRVAERRDAAALVDGAVLDIAANYYPQLQHGPSLGEAVPIAWLFPAGTAPEVLQHAHAFFERIRADGTLARLTDRYFGHVERLGQIDVVRFIERMRTLLPRYRGEFEAAEASTGIDWRLLAALAYQESQWDPLATSPTGVRGMMMLTEDTADQLRVSNRLDAKQSIRAGAQYFADLRDALPASVPEPDRTWMAIAAYNMGMGHFNGARHIAQGMKKSTDSWYEMKTVLPLLARPQYYQRLKSGKARGGEAVITAENVRMYYDILSRFEPRYRPFAERGTDRIDGAAAGLRR
ncbi:membrane-bound lytic murein transglycosylase MltF [Azospira restricta]|uniref:Membrane-bound lytic murein transglycosylase MltF n=1 Tax=Azospira restricta TaxID=404405 RepID=A0A974PX74_9RHOO|nr:membrane-bound lytic murein transglycosylase MltF [Azospira restricta]QRJ63134.1 membrane-bound lytic murein transglycosylase MltF [Azospira restricta]